MPMYRVDGTIAYPYSIDVYGEDEDDAFAIAEAMVQDVQLTQEEVEALARYNAPFIELDDIEEIEDYDI